MEYHYMDDDGDTGGMPIITLEVMSDNSQTSQTEQVSPDDSTEHPKDPGAGVHFLSEKNEETSQQSEEKDEKDPSKSRTDLLEYMMRNDGSVVCKLCGEILQSRTHWYRHKYKLHVIQPLNPAPLFQCEQCLVYFKSRKGYIGHLASRHSETLADSTPVLTNSQAEASGKEKPLPSQEELPEVKSESDSEQTPNNTSIQTSVVKQTNSKPETKKLSRGSSRDSASKGTEWEEKRSREEKLVADIIDRVRRECEAQGTGVGARRGYTRRTTVMHT